MITVAILVVIKWGKQMLSGNRSKVEKFMNATRSYIVGVDTPEEVRNHTGYRFIVGISDELEINGVPSALACHAAARIHVALPDHFHIEHEDAFVELVRLWAKSIAVTYDTLIADYSDRVVPDMFLSMCDKVVVEFSFT